MNVAVINPPFRDSSGAWITVPPQGYGGIQWVVSNLIDGLLERGHRVFLLGAPGSSPRPGLTVVDAAERHEVREWLAPGRYDVVHDHSDGRVFAPGWVPGVPWVTTHHLTGRPTNPRNAIYLSESHRRLAGADDAPVVRLPVNPAQVEFREDKSENLLFLGRVSAWKGAFEAAQFAAAAGRKLWLAGPSWEPDYLALILSEFAETVDYLGEVGGPRRVNLLSSARAALVLSQPVPGPWGRAWEEPGSTVVSEAAASGTPVVATDNGCLREIAPHVGAVVPAGQAVSPAEAVRLIECLPRPALVRAAALREWALETITGQYERLYRRVIGGESWG